MNNKNYKHREQSCNEEGRKIYVDKDLNVEGLYLFGYFDNHTAKLPIKTHLHDNRIEICILTKGCQQFRCNGEIYNLTTNKCFLTFPEDEHDTFTYAVGPIKLYWFQIDITAKNIFDLNSKASISLLNKLLSIKHKLFGINNFCIELIKKAYQALSLGNRELCSTYLTMFLKLITENKESNLLESEIIHTTKNYIKKNIYEPITLIDLANEIGLSLSRFKMRFKDETGFSPREFINLQKLEEAKNLLKSGKSITETAYELWFSSSNYFSTVFKKYTGITPTEFLKIN